MNPHMGGEVERLSDYAAREGLTIRMVVDIAAAIADDLARLHERRAHGEIVMRNVLLYDGRAGLAAPDRTAAEAEVAADIRQFGNLCRLLLAGIVDPAAAEAAREIDALLDRVSLAPVGADIPAVHSAGRQMKRVALGLKVLRARVSHGGLVRVRNHAVMPGARVLEEEAAPVRAAGRRVVMLLRAVSEAEETAAPSPGGGAMRLSWLAAVAGATVFGALAFWLRIL